MIQKLYRRGGYILAIALAKNQTKGHFSICFAPRGKNRRNPVAWNILKSEYLHFCLKKPYTRKLHWYLFPLPIYLFPSPTVYKCRHGTETAVATIISSAVALCLKDNRGNSIKWPWMVHSCRSTLFLTGLTDQSGCTGTSNRFTGHFSYRSELLFSLVDGHDDETETPKSITSRIYECRRVRIDLLFSWPTRRPRSRLPPVSNGSRMVFQPRRAELVLVFAPYPRTRDGRAGQSE